MQLATGGQCVMTHEMKRIQRGCRPVFPRGKEWQQGIIPHAHSTCSASLLATVTVASSELSTADACMKNVRSVEL